MSSSPTKYDFSGKVALVTGSSSGIGAAIATQLAKYGAQVVITGQNSENLAKVAAKIAQVSPTQTSPLVIVGNLTHEELPRQLIDQTIATFGSLDFLVNNAGGSTVAGTLAHAQMLPEFDRIMKLNLRTAVELTQLAVPHLEKTRGSVVNISSMASMLPYALVYCTSKAALDMVTKTSALELGPKGIRVNSINPGFVETSIFRSRGWDQSTIDSFYPEIAERSLMGRVGTPQDIANLTSFLLSEDARNITGSIYLSDSGCLLAPPSLGDIYRAYSKCVHLATAYSHIRPLCICPAGAFPRASRIQSLKQSSLQIVSKDTISTHFAGACAHSFFRKLLFGHPATAYSHPYTLLYAFGVGSVPEN